MRTTLRPAEAGPRSPVAPWRRTGRVAGFVAAFALLAGTAIFLLDAAGFLGPGSDYRRTSAVSLAGQPTWFYEAYFAHQRHVMWDILARDTILPVAFLALIVAALAIRSRAGLASLEGQLVVASFTVGGVFCILADLTFLAATGYWRLADWSAANAATAGKALEGIQMITHWPEAFGFAILAGGLVALARLCGRHRVFPASLGVVAWLEALLLLGIGVCGVAPYSAGYSLLSLAAGAVVGPALGIWLGIFLGRPASDVADGTLPASSQ